MRKTHSRVIDPFTVDGKETSADTGPDGGYSTVTSDPVDPPSPAFGPKPGKRRTPRRGASVPTGKLANIGNSPKGGGDVKAATNVDPQVVSIESAFGPYETLYHEFDVKAQAIYNFWTFDEKENSSEDRNERDLSEIPRYIRVTWRIAPEIDWQDPKDQGSSVGVRNFKPRNAHKRYIVNYQGSSFNIEHLSPKGFAIVKKALANGKIMPGVIAAVVELPVEQAVKDGGSVVPPEHSSDIDEAAALDDPTISGIALNDIRTNATDISNGATAPGWQTADPLSSKAQMMKREDWDGKSLADFPIGASGQITIQNGAPSSPALTLNAALATSDTQMYQSDPLGRIMGSLSKSTFLTDD